MADYDAAEDTRQSVLEAFRAIRERVAGGGPGWIPHQVHPLNPPISPTLVSPPSQS